MTIVHAACVSAAFSLANTGAAAQSGAIAKLGPAESQIAREFAGIVGARELTDGRLLVSDAVDRTIVVVDFESRAADNVARSGKGPGEYENPYRLYSIGPDSTLLIERPPARWHVFFRASLVASVVPSDKVGTAVQRFANGADTLGNVIRVLAAFDGTRDPVAPESALVIRGNRRTGRVDTVTALKTGRSEMVTEAGADGRLKSVRMRLVPFSVGDEVALFEDGWLAIVRTDPFRVDWINPAGDLLKGRQLAWPRIRITNNDILAYMARGGKEPASAAQRAEAAYWTRRVPAFVPAVLLGGLIASASGDLLIQQPPTANSMNARYHIVDRSGRLIGAVALESGQTIVAVSKKWMYVITTNHDGLQFLSRHRWPPPDS